MYPVTSVGISGVIYYSFPNQFLIPDSVTLRGDGGNGGYLFKCRSLVGIRLVLLCLCFVIYLQNQLSVAGIYSNLKLGVNVRRPGIRKKVAPGIHAADNETFTRKVIFCLFICISWCLALHISLSSDVHPNPGPVSELFSTTSDSNSSSVFRHNLILMQLNIQSR